MTPTESAVRSRVVEEHRATLRSLVDLGRQVAATWPDCATTEASAVRSSLEHALETTGLADAVLDMLRVGADTLDEPLQARLLPAPPYLAITSRGPICRATISGDRRLVLLVELFEIDRTGPSYRFVDPSPEECLTVRIR